MAYLFKRQLQAYGLIEIMLVLIVVGLLLKGTIGQFVNRFDDAKVTSTLALYNRILSATLSFQEHYGHLPGDYPHAEDEFGSDTPNGNGNRELSGQGLAPPNVSKAALFWLHLAKSRMYADAGSANTLKPLRFGKGAPRSDFDNVGFSVTFNPSDWGGHWLVLGSQTANHGDGAAFTPSQARLFLQHMGLEETQTGSVRIGQARDTSEPCLTPDGRLNFRNTTKSCVVYFRLEG